MRASGCGVLLSSVKRKGANVFSFVKSSPPPHRGENLLALTNKKQPYHATVPRSGLQALSSFFSHSNGPQRGRLRVCGVFHLSERTEEPSSIEALAICRSNAQRQLHGGRTALDRSYLSTCDGSASDNGQIVSELAKRGPLASCLEERGVIRVEGEDTFHFLQGLVTNDVNLLYSTIRTPEAAVPTPNQPAFVRPPIFAAILTPQGRVLYDTFLYAPLQGTERLDRSGSGPGDNNNNNNRDVVLADVDASAKDEIIGLLKKYRLRAKVAVEDVSGDLSVWARYGGGSGNGPAAEAGAIGWGGTQESTGATAAKANGEGFQWFKDPRLSALGLRGLFPQGTVPPLVEADEMVDAAHYKMWRYENGVPEGVLEIPSGEALPLEYNLDALNGVSYDKGCYVGQELTARTHHRGTIRKRAITVWFLLPNDGKTEVEKGPKPGTEVVERESGKSVGKVIAAIGPSGLALLRLEPAIVRRSQLVASVAGGEQVIVQPNRPTWWSEKWGYEERESGT